MGLQSRAKKAGFENKYKIKPLSDEEYNQDIDIINIRQRLIQTTSQYDMVNNVAGRNIFAQEVRMLLSIIWHKLDESDRIYFKMMADRFTKAVKANQQLRLIYHQHDTLQEILTHNKLRSYEAWEDDDGGSLSEYIKNELADGRGFSLLIKAPPRSSKSWTALRIGLNVSGKQFEVGSPEDPKDVIYTDYAFHQRRKQRRKEGTLSFSTVIIDEGIEVVDAMRGIWDESIQSIIKILKTGFYENWLLIVVTPDESDIAKKVRNSFHAVLEPYYDDTALEEGDMKRKKNWNEKSGYSTWKFHANDERIGIHGLGKITKINIMKPKKEVTDPYIILSKFFKDKIQVREEIKSEKREVKVGDREGVIKSKIDEILNNPAVRKEVSGVLGYPTAELVQTYFKLGQRPSVSISSRAKKALMEREKPKVEVKDGVDKTGTN
jgi:hypothetical protein